MRETVILTDRLQRTDAFGLDEELVGERGGAQDAPRSPVIMELFLEERPAFLHHALKFLICFLVCHNCCKVI